MNLQTKSTPTKQPAIHCEKGYWDYWIDNEEIYWTYWTVRLASVAISAMECDLEAFEITALEFGILNRCHNGEANTVTELTQIFPTDMPTISRRVSDLVDRGLLLRRRLQDDRRVVMLELTEEAQELMPQIAERTHSLYDRLMKDIDKDEQRAFMSALQKMLSNLEEHRPYTNEWLRNWALATLGEYERMHEGRTEDQ